MFLESAGVHPYATFWLDVADKFIKGLAVCVAAVWTYYNQVRSRTYRPKPGCSVTGEMFSKDANYYVLCTCKLKNYGQSKVSIHQQGTALEAVTLSEDGRKQIPGAEVFKEHAWVEPDEEITEPIILRIPDPSTFVALRLNLRVVSESIEWNASCILKETRQETRGANDEVA